MGEVVSPNLRYTCREFWHEVNWKVVSPDSTVGIYIQYIYITKIVVLVSEPVRGRSRATELPCLLLFYRFLSMFYWFLITNLYLPHRRSMNRSRPHRDRLSANSQCPPPRPFHHTHWSRLACFYGYPATRRCSWRRRGRLSASYGSSWALPMTVKEVWSLTTAISH